LVGLECRCGATIVDRESDERYGLESHHAMPGYETFECEDCGRVFGPEWVGMDFELLEGPRRPVTMVYYRHYTKYYDAVESVEDAAGRLCGMRDTGSGAPRAIYDSEGELVWHKSDGDYITDWSCEQFGHRAWSQPDWLDGEERCVRCHERRPTDDA
jgi:hypothetical protein